MANLQANETRTARINYLKAIREVELKEIELKKVEISNINEELLSLEWQEISWMDLEIWLKNNRPENDYENNPAVRNAGGHISGCKLNKDGELQIGADYYNDHFPRGKNVFIRYDFKSYRNY